MAALLEQVLFNHDPNDKRGSALNLRINAALPLPLPEWRQMDDGVVQSAPAAYATRVIVAPLLAVGARVRWLGAPRAAIEVRALQASPPGPTSWRPGILGELAARTCMLGPDGDTGLILFLPRGGWLSSAPVGIHTVAWRWQYRLASSAPWIDFATSEHQVFTTLLPPSAPWAGAPFLDLNLALLWSEALEVACYWARGATSTDEAAALICLNLYAMGGGTFEYGCAVFGHEMYTNSLLSLFDLSAMLERIGGGEGNGRYVNCTDCACTVSTLANALGAGLWQSRMGSYLPDFALRDILTIGSSLWSSPCNSGLGFMFHEVAWSGNAGEFDAVYDASLMVNAELRPFMPIAPMLAANLGFGVPWGGLYRSMLAQSDEQLICHPLPEERRCRALE